jgi:ankyrin repeat protein
MKGHAAVVQLLIQKGADISLSNKAGFSPLNAASDAASQEGHTDVVDILIQAGADVHQILIQAGADVHQTTTDQFDTFPLGIAAGRGHTETVKRLLAAGATVNHQNKYHQNKEGRTALFFLAGLQSTLPP